MINSNTPILKKDRNHELIQDSYQDRAFQAEYSGTNMIYRGYAIPGTPPSSPGWQIAKLNYTTSNLDSIQWPENEGGRASSNYEFVWDDRASYTYV